MKNEKWINDTALLFYQIFSTEYECDDFCHTLTLGGGGNSPLCATWEKFSNSFVIRRISKNAYNLLMSKLSEDEKKQIIKDKNKVTIPKRIIEKDRKSWFKNNAKSLEKRRENDKFFHFDHNPSNKKVLVILKKLIKENKDNPDYVKKLAVKLKKIQYLDLITVEEDEKRTSEDRKLKDKLSSYERDKLIGGEFYYLFLK